MNYRRNGIYFSLLLPLFLVLSATFSNSSKSEKTISTSQEINLTDTEPTTTVEKETATYYNVGNLPLNRVGTNIKWRQDVKGKYNGAHTGFLFNVGDNTTQHWRPQGVVGMGKKVNKKSFLIVSWYGRPKTTLNKKDYKDRGARISVVNNTSMNKIKYRHILLVDKNLKPFKGTHAGGLAVVGDKLHVADSRGSKGKPLADGSYDKILVFDLTKIEKLKTAVKKYKYVLRLESSYNSPINPGYLSYNKTDNELMIGSFTCNDKGNCKKDFSTGIAKFVFGAPGSIDRNSPTTTLGNAETKSNRHFRQVQGMSTFTHEGTKYLVTAHSFALAPSALNLFEQKNGEWEWIGQRQMLAAGIEDIYVSGKNIWTVSEFSPIELGDRAVVAWRISKLVKELKAKAAKRK
ncbi:MAG: hypothetical protein ACPG19_12375 [Saprospiraceae bacterium]